MTAAAIVGTILVPAFYVIIQKLREDTVKKWHNKNKGDRKDEGDKNEPKA